MDKLREMQLHFEGLLEESEILRTDSPSKDVRFFANSVNRFLRRLTEAPGTVIWFADMDWLESIAKGKKDE